MKKFISYILFTLIVVSCGTESGHFRIKGRLRNFNQGEFYIYSPDGGIVGTDTIKVADGRFSYETEINEDATFIIIFPNYSELAVFGQSGTTAEISGDASHLKEVEVKGNKANEDMTKLRLAISDATPPQAKKEIENFINTNPKSIINFYLLRKYFTTIPEPDYDIAATLARKMADADKENVKASILAKQLKDIAKVKKGGMMPHFTAKDINGKTVSKNDLNGKVNIVHVWAGWNNESTSIQRDLHKKKKEYGDKLQILGICIDADTTRCKRTIRNDSLQWHTICDQKLWESPIVKQLAIYKVPFNIVADEKGKIIAINASREKLKEIIQKQVK